MLNMTSKTCKKNSKCADIPSTENKASLGQDDVAVSVVSTTLMALGARVNELSQQLRAVTDQRNTALDKLAENESKMEKMQMEMDAMAARIKTDEKHQNDLMKRKEYTEKITEMQLKCKEKNVTIKTKNRELEALKVNKKTMIQEKNKEIRELQGKLKGRQAKIEELEQKLSAKDSSLNTPKSPCSATESQLRETIDLLEKKLAYESDHFTRIQQFIYKQTETDVITELHEKLKEVRWQKDLAVIELEWHRNNEKEMEKKLDTAYRYIMRKLISDH